MTSPSFGQPEALAPVAAFEALDELSMPTTPLEDHLTHDVPSELRPTACNAGECDQFATWQESLWALGTHSNNTIYDKSSDKVGDCRQVHGCIFKQAVEIQGAQDA